MTPEAKEWVDKVGAGGMGMLEQMLQGNVRPTKTIPFPGYRGKPKDEGGLGWRVAIWALGADETMDADAAAMEFLSTRWKIDRYDVKALFPVELDLEQKVQQLLKALRNPEAPTQPFARLAQSIRQLDPDEIQALFEMSLEFQRARSPLHVVKSLEELTEVLQYLGKASTDEIFLRRYDAVSLRFIVSELVSRYMKPAIAAAAIASTTAKSLDTSSTSE